MRKLACVLCMWLALPVATAFAEYHTLIVLSQDDHTLYDLNATTGEVARQVQLAGAPREAVFSWDEKTLFVSVPDAGHVAIIDATTFKQIGQVENAEFKRPAAGSIGTPFGLATTIDGHKLYIGVEGGLVVYDSKLLIFNPEFKQAGKKIAVGPKDGQHFKIQGTTDKLYYTNRRDNQVVVIDTKTDAIVKTVPVPGGPMDVTFLYGNEAWIAAEDGSITIIDTAKDDVKQTFATGGKGPGRIALAQDIRFIAVTHSDSGDTTIIHPLKKEVLATIKTGPGSSAASFVPDTKNPTHELYVTTKGDSTVEIIDLSTMKLSSHKKVGKGLVDSLLHYRFAHGWGPSREGTVRRMLETDLFTAYANAMFQYDVSPIHEHRGDMAAIYTGTGTAKMGCWDPACPPEAMSKGIGGLLYNERESHVGGYTGIFRGTLHIEEGATPDPRRMITFDLKNNYYRMMDPPRKESVFAKSGMEKIAETRRIWHWDTTLLPGGKPFQMPEGDYAMVYMGGGLIRVVTNGVPDIINRYFNDFEYNPHARTIEPLTNPVHIGILEFK